LHSPEYREQYAADLKKVLPRIPYAPDFKAFSQAGRKLADLHLNYETVEPWPVQEDAKPKGDLNDLAYYRVEKMRFASLGGRNKDKSVIVFNSRITLRGIPLEAYDYVVNGKSAIEWVMERYQVSTDKNSGIKNDPNDWCREHNDPAYILNLVKRVIRVSMETNQIVDSLPSLLKDKS
jgi:predicted helicase